MAINNWLTSLQFPRCPLIINDYETSEAHLTHQGCGANWGWGFCFHYNIGKLYHHKITVAMRWKEGVMFYYYLYKLFALQNARENKSYYISLGLSIYLLWPLTLVCFVILWVSKRLKHVTHWSECLDGCQTDSYGHKWKDGRCKWHQSGSSQPHNHYLTVTQYTGQLCRKSNRYVPSCFLNCSNKNA